MVASLLQWNSDPNRPAGPERIGIWTSGVEERYLCNDLKVVLRLARIIAETASSIRWTEGLAVEVVDMKYNACIIANSIHLLALAVSTYIAAHEIESIIVTGVICAVTGLVATATALLCRRFVLAAAACLAPFLAQALFISEAFFLQLGPERAALPFCIIFIINQVISTLVILTQLRILIAPQGTRVTQVTIKTLLVSMVSFSVFFAVARVLLQQKHDLLMYSALGLLGLTFVGLSMVFFAALVHRHTLGPEDAGLSDLKTGSHV